MSMFTAFNINASGLTAQRYRMDIISENVANANTTRTADGTPYRRKVVTFEEKAGGVEKFGAVFNKAKNNYCGKGGRRDGGHLDGDEQGVRPVPPRCGRKRLRYIPECEYHYGNDQLNRCEPCL